MVDDAVRPDVTALSDDALEEINRLWTIARTCTNSAHDVNNALQVISGSAELLMASPSADPQQTRRLASVRAQAARAADVLGRLVHYVRDTDVEFHPVDLGALADTAASMRAATLGRAQIVIDVTRSDADPYRVSVQPQKALQLLLNLFLIAEGLFTPGVGGRIDVRLDRRAAAIVLTFAPRIAGGGPHEAAAVRGSSDSSLFVDLQQWSARRLAASQRGELTMTRADGRVAGLTLTLPPAS